MSAVPEGGPRKPGFGAPCNGCGVCCVATACGLAVEYVPGATYGKPCPALEWEHGRSWCGMVRRPFTHAPHLLEEFADVVEKTGRPRLEEITGAQCREALGGDGGCDAGDPDGIERDPADGLTAADYARRVKWGQA